MYLRTMYFRVPVQVEPGPALMQQIPDYNYDIPSCRLVRPLKDEIFVH